MSFRFAIILRFAFSAVLEIAHIRRVDKENELQLLEGGNEAALERLDN